MNSTEIGGTKMRKSPYKIAVNTALAVLSSMIAFELVGINRVVRRIVQVHFLELEIVLGITLWLLLMLFLIKRKNTARNGLLPLLGFGFLAGSLSGAVAAASLSALNYHERGLFDYISSWKDLASFLGISILGTLGWLLGLFSAVLTYFLLSIRSERISPTSAP